MLTGNGHAKTTLSWSPKGATAATAVTLWLHWEPWGEVFALVRWLIRSTQIWNHRSTSIVLTNSRLSSPCVATAVLTHPRGTNCSLSSYLCPAVCFQEILFKQARTCHWNQLNFSDTSASRAHERISLFINTGKGIWLSYVYFGSNRPSYTRAVFNSSGARLRELCQWGGTKLSQGDFLLVWRVMLAHYHWNLVIHLCYRYWQTCFTRMSFETCCWRGHLSGCFNAPHFLLTRVPSSTPFPSSLAHTHIAACLLICVLPSAFKKFCSNKQGHVTGTSWIFQTHLLPERMKESHFLSIQAREFG